MRGRSCTVKGTLHPLLLAVVSVLLSLVSGGCSNHMGVRDPGIIDTTANRTLGRPFKKHAFAADCFDVLECRVEYAGRYQIERKGPQPGVPPGGLKAPNWAQISIPNFPPPARVTWVSLDGEKREALVDLSKIFKHRKVLHSSSLDLTDVSERITSSHPDIFIFVIDRRIEVYMKYLVELKSLMYPDKPWNDIRSDLILAYAKTY